MKSILPLAVFALVLSSCQQETEKQEKFMTESQILAQAKEIHKAVITLDTHCDINVKNFTDTINYTQRLTSQVNLPKMQEGGLDVPWFVVYTGQGELNEEGYKAAYENAISKFDAIHKLCEEIAPDKIQLATSSEEAKAIWKSGKKVAMIGIENGYPIGTDISNVQKFYDLGGRYMSLAHNGHSQLSDSNTGEEDNVWLHNGLSDLGKEVIKEMNRVGLMIDISHPSKEAIKQMIELSKVPVIASHSSARTLGEHSRNLDDEQLEWIKQNGGVVQTVAFKSYLDPKKHETFEREAVEVLKEIADSIGIQWMERKEMMALPMDERMAYYENYQKMLPIQKKKLAQRTDLPPQVNVADFVDHIDYLVQRIGLEHVGISSDFDGGGGIEGWSDASETLNVTTELIRRGYTQEEIEKLWSGNLFRVLDAVQAYAAQP